MHHLCIEKEWVNWKFKKKIFLRKTILKVYPELLIHNWSFKILQIFSSFTFKFNFHWWKLVYIDNWTIYFSILFMKVLVNITLASRITLWPYLSLIKNCLNFPFSLFIQILLQKKIIISPAVHIVIVQWSK